MRARAYATRSRPGAPGGSRARVLGAVRELLEEGTFHESTVEAVATRAGVSRASLYQHFRSRLELVDAICETIAGNTALQTARRASTLDELLDASVDFWVSEEKLVGQLYGAAAVDPAARSFVERQRRDRYRELERLLRELGRDPDASLPALAMLTSFETYRELRRYNRLSTKAVKERLRESGRRLLAG